MDEVDDSPEHIRSVIWRKIAIDTHSAKVADDLTDWVMGLLRDYHWGPTQKATKENFLGPRKGSGVVVQEDDGYYYGEGN